MDNNNSSRPRRGRPRLSSRRSFPPPPHVSGSRDPGELRLRAGLCARETETALLPYTADLFRRLATDYVRRADAIERGEPLPLSSVLPNPVGRQRGGGRRT
jgi:hypothetical protein